MEVFYFMLGVIGVLFSLALIMFIVYRGFGVIPAAIICSLVVILTTGGEIWPMLEGGFLAGTTGFIGKYFFLLSTGAFLGQVLGDSGSAKAIGDFLVKKLGAEKVMLITTLTTAILSYGGVSLFVQTFTVIPLVLGIYKQADIPKRFMVGSFVLGNGTFAMTALPGLPSLPNLIPTNYLGTTPMAAPIMGIICSIFMFTAGQLYLARELKKCRERGEGFKINMATDEKFLALTDERELPSVGKAFLPLIVVLVLIVTTSGMYASKNFGVSIALVIGALLTYALNWNNLPNKLTTMNEGFKVALIPLLNTAALVGCGTVVSQSSAFQSFVDFAMGLQFSPYISAALATNIVAGVTGSASGGLAIFMKTLGQQYLAMGLNPEAFHRIAAIACGGLDSLPHNGAVVTMFMLMGTTHKESYKYVFVIMCVIPIITTILAITLGTIGII